MQESPANGDAPIREVVVLGGRGTGRGGGGATVCLAGFSQGDSGDVGGSASASPTPNARRGSTSPISPCSLASPKVVHIISTPPHATSQPTARPNADSSSSSAAPTPHSSSAAAAVDSPVANAIGDQRLGIIGGSVKSIGNYEGRMRQGALPTENATKTLLWNSPIEEVGPCPQMPC